MAAEHQHYVPQLLLRGFLSQIGKGSEKEQVRVYDLEQNASFATSIANIMGENRYNEWWIDEQTVATIEPASGKIESELAPLIDKIRYEKRLEITPQNVANLALFMAFQLIRTKKMRMMPERFNRQLTAHIARMGLDSSKVDGLIDWDRDTLKRQHVKSQVSNLGKFASIMSEKVFFVMTAPKGASFYLSDHPVVFHSDEKRTFMRGLGIGVPYIQIYLPLSHDVLLCAYDPAVLGGLLKSRDEEMKRGQTEALSLLLRGKITAEQMKSFIEEAKKYDEVGPLVDAIRAGDPVSCGVDQVGAYNSLQVFHAHRFVVDPEGKFSIVPEMIAAREASFKRELGTE